MYSIEVLSLIDVHMSVGMRYTYILYFFSSSVQYGLWHTLAAEENYITLYFFFDPNDLIYSSKLYITVGGIKNNIILC